ncbi:unnamed protein product [Arabis nemorensis]|uniref:Uncharacterized protein n=1 Tax=Arabis nemorensis TaxID=586526 RepID=A0A565AP57_9BRAS|nr:unnamed protein product [Arabis nemorensis]
MINNPVPSDLWLDSLEDTLGDMEGRRTNAAGKPMVLPMNAAAVIQEQTKKRVATVLRSR